MLCFPADLIIAYSFLDPHTEHAKLAAYIVGIAAAEIVIFVVVRYIMMLRGFLIMHLFSASSSGYADSEHYPDVKNHGGHNQKEGLEDWEEVDRPSFGNGERRLAI
jgi:1,4-dihydroxy-2-naphthoate octaprenyltransferase